MNNLKTKQDLLRALFKLLSKLTFRGLWCLLQVNFYWYEEHSDRAFTPEEQRLSILLDDCTVPG